MTVNSNTNPVLLTLNISFLVIYILYSNNFNISVNEAGNIAIWFIADNIKSNPLTKWNDDTRISKIVNLYDEKNNVISYSFELKNNYKDNGYIIISASKDMSLIQEYSDEAIPLYNDSKIKDYNKIYYTAPLEYIVKKDKDLYLIDGKKLKYKEIKSKFAKNLLKAEKNKKYFDKMEEKGLFDITHWTLGYDGQLLGEDGFAGIYDSYAYVNDRYGTGWVSDYYNNSLEADITRHLTSEGQYNNDCTLIAISTIFEFHRRNGESGIPTSFSQIYTDTHEIAVPYGFDEVNGTDPTDIDNIVNDLWDKYGHSSGSGNNDYLLSWNTAKNEINASRPFVFNIANGYYANHSIVVYAYSSFKNSSYSYNVDFLKAADGWSTGNRYIDFTEFVGFGSWTKINP